MERLAYVMTLLVAILVAAGCSDGEDRASVTLPEEESADPKIAPATPPPPPPPPAPLPPPATGDLNEGPPETDTDEPEGPRPQLPAIHPTPHPAPPPAAEQQPAPVEQPVIRLSTGVALPQTTPAGTVMSFSVEYEFVRGGPSASASYFWAIQRAQGPAGKMRVQLNAEGTLQTLVREWRSNDGPFRCHIEDGQGAKLSQPISLH